MAGRIRVTLRRSIIGEKPKTRQTIRGLGLNKLHSSNELPDNASVRGMIHVVRHLVEVTEEGRQTPDAKRQKKNADD